MFVSRRLGIGAARAAACSTSRSFSRASLRPQITPLPGSGQRGFSISHRTMSGQGHGESAVRPAPDSVLQGKTMFPYEYSQYLNVGLAFVQTSPTTCTTIKSRL